MRSRRLTVTFVIGTAFAGTHAACGEDPTQERFLRSSDAGPEADVAADRAPDVDPTLGGPCSEDRQCDDQVPCTFDRCDTTLSRCRFLPDDSQCADDSYCNGREICEPRRGCIAGAAITCQDEDSCTIDRCNEPTKSCEHKARDMDGDGDPTDHCQAKGDCDDFDPNIHSKHSEVCGNFKDDNCDGEVDEAQCAMPANDVCDTALSITAPGTYLLTTVAAKKDYSTTCSVTSPASARDVVVNITVPGAIGDPAQDIELWATADNTSNELAIATEATCGQSGSELSCAHIDQSASARTIARSRPAGSTIAALLTSAREGAVDLRVDFRTASARPDNESCTSPENVAVDTPFTVSIIDPTKDLATACDKSKTGERAYAFTLPSPADVRIFGSTLAGPGKPVISLRDGTCENELRCREAASAPVFARSLAAGTHVFAVSGTEQLDASILVKTYPPTVAPPTQSCATAPPVIPNTSFLVDLSAQEDAINNGCLAGGSAAAFSLTLAEASDVLVIGRFAQNDSGAVSLSGAACTPSDVIQCASGTTPTRVSKRNLPAGSYRIVIADELGLTAQLSVLVRPATPPTRVAASDDCVAPFVLPNAGGFFTGDTTNHDANFNAGCDAPGQPISGAPDQIMKLVLAESRRVVFDMTGSVLTTVLDLRKGTACPGIEIPNGCHAGLNPNRSFLDQVLAAGTYFVQVDGYAGEKGTWNLDVRVLDP